MGDEQHHQIGRATTQRSRNDDDACRQHLPCFECRLGVVRCRRRIAAAHTGDLLGENQALKCALKNLEAELTDVLHEGKLASEGDAAAIGIETEEEVDEHSAQHGSFSPRTRRLLAEYHPSQVELPWSLVGDTIEVVLRAKLQLLRTQLVHRESAAAAVSGEEEHLTQRLRTKIEEQQAIIHEQDQLLQSYLYSGGMTASGVEALREEQQEQRRLSRVAEVEDIRRRAQISARAEQSSVLASPMTLRVSAGGITAASLPVFATPVFRRSAPPPSEHSPNDSPSIAIRSASPTAVEAARSSPKARSSKWLMGGVVAPTFTPAKRGVVHARSIELNRQEVIELHDHHSGAEEEEEEVLHEHEHEHEHEEEEHAEEMSAHAHATHTTVGRDEDEY
jgi:hypothetical protein